MDIYLGVGTQISKKLDDVIFFLINEWFKCFIDALFGNKFFFMLQVDNRLYTRTLYRN